jgi:large subunit ribosomal protein L33
MARDDIRPVIKPRSTAGTGCTQVTRENHGNHGNDPARMRPRTYHPVVRRHVLFREER